MTAALIARVEAEPDQTLSELTQWIGVTHAVHVHFFSVSRALRAAGFTYEKSLLALEAGRARVQRDRHIWRAHRQPIMRGDPHRLVIRNETFYEAADALQADLEAWLVHYNTERPHLGYRNMGRSPIETVMSFVSQEG